MHLRGHDSNHAGPLGEVLKWVPEASDVLRRCPAPCALETKRLGNGMVQGAVIGVLAAAGRALSVVDVHGAVEERLGGSVSKDSVGSCMSTGARGAHVKFERTTRGWYRLADDA